MQPNFPTPGCTLLSSIPRQNPKKLHHQRYMFLLQLQLYVLTIIRVTLRRIQKPFRRKSTFCKFKHIILSKGYKESQFYKLYTMIVANEPYTDHLYWQESTWFLFTSVYFDTTVCWEVQLIKNTLKQTNFEDKTVESTQLSLVLVGLRDFQIFPDRTAHAWSVEAGMICSVSVVFVRVGSQISPRRAKKDSNIPSPGRTRSVKCPTPGPTKTIKSPPHALPLLPAGMTLIGA